MSVPDEVLKLISESGNNFHAKVARWMQADGWHVSVSPYYMDQTQNKAREIDLVAEKLWPVMDHWGQPMGDVAVRLFVECKFIPSYSVFWFADKDREACLFEWSLPPGQHVHQEAPLLGAEPSCSEAVRGEHRSGDGQRSVLQGVESSAERYGFNARRASNRPST